MTNRFVHDRRGNFAVIGALAMMPLMLAVGLAVDIGAAVNLQTRMQSATDSAALALAREKTRPTIEQAKAMAAKMLNGNFRGLYSNLQVARNGAEWEVTADVASKNTFMHLIGMDRIPLKVSSRAAHSTMSYEIALVLDTTGSMEGDKIANLKKAAKDMITTMTKDLEEKERVKFALVPFSTFVNVGPKFGPTLTRSGNNPVSQSGGAPWLDLNGATTATGAEIVKGVSRFRIFHNLGQSWEGCVETRQPSSSRKYDVEDLPATSGDPRSLFVPAFHFDDVDGDNKSYKGNDYLKDAPSWPTSIPSAHRKLLNKYGLPVNSNGTLASGNWHTPPGMDFSATAIYGSGYRENKGPNFFCDSDPIVPLTTDYAKVRAAVDAIKPLGNTNTFEGVMWGWRVLSPGEPFAEGRPKDAFNNEKVLILLSDGNNTWNKLSGNSFKSNYSSFGFLSQGRLVSASSSDAAITKKMDEKTLEGCTNAKADGIVIYTIRLELNDAGSSELLKKCASSEDHYFDVPDSDALQETFDEIRYRINRIRLTH